MDAGNRGEHMADKSKWRRQAAPYNRFRARLVHPYRRTFEPLYGPDIWGTNHGKIVANPVQQKAPQD